MKTPNLIKPPTRRELVTLRLMICLGVLSMLFFLINVLNPLVIGDIFLYWMLLIAFTFTCLKILHEWYHYFYITVPAPAQKIKDYSVDIFTTFCKGEPYAMIEETLIAIQAITYPHTAYLCDESDDPYLKHFCEQLGILHVTRVDKTNAKAGNINNALRQATGELCVVLDPDHVPFPDFLDPIVDHFNDPAIGFVQIVQAYKNIEESLIAKSAAQQTYQFYGPMMMTMNRYGTVMAIGANCTFRRAALDSIGGHAAGLAEDMHTAMQLHAKGWKSIYVPVVQARGLVPSTLSAYYKQQLKWSRGVFDLFVTSYPKLFKHFSLRQKLHYGVIPVHYLSGIVFLINFLIPIISLCWNVSPMQISVSSFGLAVLPLITAIVLIRQFVQWWVMEDKERGFHFEGGLLMIGTWWIYILGLIYTIFRTTVPYNPTPKDGREENNWPLNIPNLVVMVISLSAIFYGLSIDWNPYNLAMSAFAMLNASFMLFAIIASRQQQLRALGRRYKLLHYCWSKIQIFKSIFWVFRRRVYTGIRSTALLLMTMAACSIVYFFQLKKETRLEIPLVNHKKDLLLLGTDSSPYPSQLFQPNPQTQKSLFRTLPLSFAWGEYDLSGAAQQINSAFEKGLIPLISWNSIEDDLSRNKNLGLNKSSFYRQIVNGEHDTYLMNFCKLLKDTNRPFFIRFAQEADKFVSTKNSRIKGDAQAFKAAWKYLHNFFQEQGIYDAIWVWHPYNPSLANSYFPGRSYVDWIAISSPVESESEVLSENLNLPQKLKLFEKSAAFQYEIPVVVIYNNQFSWKSKSGLKKFNDLHMIKEKYSQIKGLVLVNGEKKCQYNGNASSKLILSQLGNSEIQQSEQGPVPKLSFNAPISVESAKNDFNIKRFLKSIKGISYSKGKNWSISDHPLRIKELLSDFQEMKHLGLNTIKINDSGIYDRNIFRAANQTGIRVCYSFPIVSQNYTFTLEENLAEVRDNILKIVNSLKDNKDIISWNLENQVFRQLAQQYFRPELNYHEDSYLIWLKTLVDDIKKADPIRPVTIDIPLDDNTTNLIQRLSSQIPKIDAYGILVDKKTDQIGSLSNTDQPYFFSSVSVSSFIKTPKSRRGFFISSWQDEKLKEWVSFDGIKDFWNRDKISLLQLKSVLTNEKINFPALKVKILKPSVATMPGEFLGYHALVLKGDDWFLADSLKNNLNFEWKLIKRDKYNNPVSFTNLGTGGSMKFTIPDNAQQYSLYLYIIQKGVVIDIVISELNTPFW